MKIAIVVTDHRDELRQYADPEPYFHPAPMALLEGLATVPECEIHVLSCTQQELRAPARLAGNIFYHSLLVPKWGWLRGGYMGCIRAVRRKLCEIKPEVVNGQGTERYCALAAIYSGLPNVVTVHGNMRLVAEINNARPFSFQWLSARLEGWTLPRTGGVICLSNYTLQAVEALARRTWVLPNAVAGSFYGLPRQPVLPKQVLCVATINHRKNQIRLIRSLDSLAKESSFELVFLGGADTQDPYVHEFHRLVEERPWCRFQGFASRTELHTALARATLLVLPSLEENCPMVVLEAMAAGVPVAAAKVGGVPDLIADGIDGLLFQPTVEESTRAAVAELLANTKKREDLARRAKEKAQQVFHPHKIAEQHVAIYRQVRNMHAEGSVGSVVKA
jgi:glycosyltransferase involved in cell wall biosynthesis